MRAMAERPRGTGPALLLALVSALTGAAAWLGVHQSGVGASQWQTFMEDTASTGSLSFRTVITVSGDTVSVERAVGAIDFLDHDADQLSVVRSPSMPPQWSQVLVVAGQAYDRPGTDRRGGPRFSGVWTRLGTFAVAPFQPLSGPPGSATVAAGDQLTRVGAAVVDGTPTTEYRLMPVTITCLDATGARTAESELSWAWVDGDGRIRRFASLTSISAGSYESTRLAMTTFDQFGTSVSVDPPARVTGPAAPRISTGLAGCLVTPG